MDKPCKFPGCTLQQSFSAPTCKRHWLMLPQRVKHMLKSGQESRAIEWIHSQLRGEVAMLKAKAEKVTA